MSRTTLKFPAMRTIYKIKLEDREGLHRTEINSGFKPLSLQLQNGKPVLYVEVDPSRPTYMVEYGAVITGDRYAAPINSQYVGTAMLEEGRFVLHYFFPVE